MDAPCEPSAAARAGAWARATLSSTAGAARAAPTTAATLVVLTSLHVARLLAGRPSLSTLCLSTPAILSHPLPQAYRLASSALTHAGWLHLLFNVAALGPLLARREAATSAAGALGDLTGLVLVGGLLFLGAGALTTLPVLGKGLPTPGCAVGISGAIFGLMTAEASGPSAISAAPVALAGGALSIPGRAYPWALIVALQLLMPGLSAAGHVCGALAGEGLGGARRAGWLPDPWGCGGVGLPQTAGGGGGGGEGGPSLLSRFRSLFRGGDGAGGPVEWAPLPGEAPDAAAAQARAAAGAAAAARAAAAAAAAGR